MGTAYDYQRWISIADVDLLAHTMLFFPSFTALRTIQSIVNRRINHAHHRDAVFDQGDIDRELTVAANKLLGAI